LKILYAIQGGSGQLSRAREIYPELCRHGDVDMLVSGMQADAELPVPVRYRLQGVSGDSANEGDLNLATAIGRLQLSKAFREARSLHIRQYDLIVNDFEPISAWAAKMRRVPCIALSHQWALLHAQAPAPELRDWKGLALLRHYAPSTGGYGFHFKAYNRKVFTPLISKEVRQLRVTDEGHYTVYLPAYDDDTLLAFLQRFDMVRWEVFSRHCREGYEQGNVRVKPLENGAFLASMASCRGVLCNAGFDRPAEALHLGKKLLVIPAAGQYDQQCNAAALATLNVPSLKKISLKYYDRITFWLSGGLMQVQVDYLDQTRLIVDTLVGDFLQSRQHAASGIPLPG
jgi:uncharacterized protein (TIGR00661 family)